jgi:hypothetical protein
VSRCRRHLAGRTESCQKTMASQRMVNRRGEDADRARSNRDKATSASRFAECQLPCGMLFSLRFCSPERARMLNPPITAILRSLPITRRRTRSVWRKNAPRHAHGVDSVFELFDHVLLVAAPVGQTHDLLA